MLLHPNFVSTYHGVNALLAQCLNSVKALSRYFQPCYHNCTTCTKPIQLSKKEFVSAFYVLTLSTNEKSSHRAAEGRKWKNKFRKSVRAVVFYPTCVSIYNLSMVCC